MLHRTVDSSPAVVPASRRVPGVARSRARCTRCDGERHWPEDV